MARCKYCYRTIPDEAEFCPYCGKERPIRKIVGEIEGITKQVKAKIEKRIPFRRVIKKALSDIMSHRSVAGAKVQVAGRLDGTEIARKEFVKAGRLPLQTIRAKIDYAFDEAICSYGKIGIKVWIYKEEEEK